MISSLLRGLPIGGGRLFLSAGPNLRTSLRASAPAFGISASRLYETQSRNVSARWHQRMKQAKEKGKLDVALNAYDEMKLSGFAPSRETFHLVATTALRSDHLGACLQILEDMKSYGLIPDVILYNIVLTTAAKKKQVDLCFKLKTQMGVLGVPANTRSYLAILDACERTDRFEKAFEVARMMRAEGIEPTEMVFTKLLEMCQKSATLLPQAEVIFKEMTDAGITPTRLSYNAYIALLAKHGDPLEAYRLSRLAWEQYREAHHELVATSDQKSAEEKGHSTTRIPSLRHTLTPLTYNTSSSLVKGLARINQVEQAVEVLLETHEHIITRVHELYNEGLADNLIRSHNSLTSRVLAKAVAAGRLDFVRDIIKVVDPSAGIKPALATLRSVVEAALNGGDKELAKRGVEILTQYSKSDSMVNNLEKLNATLAAKGESELEQIVSNALAECSKPSGASPEEQPEKDANGEAITTTNKE